jgi:hypothetical protein
MMKKILFSLAIASIVLSACKKEQTSTATKLNESQLTTVTTSATDISSKLQSWMGQILTQAADSGKTIEKAPSLYALAGGPLGGFFSSKLKSGSNYTWTGPDASGWYIYTYVNTGYYTCTEKVRYKDSTITCIVSYEYNGADGNFSDVITTEYTHYTKNKKVLWKGYCDITIKTFGDLDISNVEWKFAFTDWDPATGAGTYDWYWSGNSLGGNSVPYHRYLNIIATDRGTIPSSLHVKITWYDNGGVSVGSWEYNTTWTPVDMPDLP